MDQELNAYLDRVDRYLKPMSAWERVDIVQEIRSEMLELAGQGLSPQAIMERLGAPRELAAAYLRDMIVKNPGFSWRRLGSVAAFYSLAGLGGMFVLPVTSITAVVFMLCGALVPAAALLSLAASLVGIDTPWVVMQLGNWTAPPLAAFPIAVVMGLLLLLAGWACGKLLWDSCGWLVRSGGACSRGRLAAGIDVKKERPDVLIGPFLRRAASSRECFPRW